jgi:peptidoglycan/xylan/chitin deacetylase (PgdA/CDA1 family)
LNISVPILMYHEVAPRPLAAFRKYTVSAGAFAAQMRWLALAGYVPIDFDALLRHRRGEGEIPPRSVIITFDDGFRGCVEHAVPILRARGFTAVFFLVVGLMGQTSRWLYRERGIELPLLDWQTARELEAMGFQCEAHSLSHPHMARLPLTVCRDELFGARSLLAEHLGHEVRHLAYPYGSFNGQVRALAAATGYRSACSVQIGLSDATDDPLALHRVPVTGYDTLLDFACRLRTAQALGDLLRGQADGLRRRLRPLEGTPG